MPIGASRQVGHFFNAIHHHDRCRLVHPAKWDIGQFRGGLCDGCRFVHPFRRFILYVIQFIRFSNTTSQFHIHFHIVFSKIYSIYVLISYTHSHTHSYTHSCTYLIYSFTYAFIYSFMYLFHIYLVNYQNP